MPAQHGRQNIRAKAPGKQSIAYGRTIEYTDVIRAWNLSSPARASETVRFSAESSPEFISEYVVRTKTNAYARRGSLAEDIVAAEGMRAVQGSTSPARDHKISKLMLLSNEGRG